MVNDFSLTWANEAKYLGVVLKTGVKFACNFHPSKCLFFKSVNSIMSVLGGNPSIKVALSLFRSKCIPVLTYGLAVIPLSKADLQSLSFAYNNIFSKLFNTNNRDTIEKCQFFCGFWPLSVLVDYLKLSFILSMHKVNDLNRNNVLHVSVADDVDSMMKKYELDEKDSIQCIKFKLWKQIEHSIVIDV